MLINLCVSGSINAEIKLLNTSIEWKQTLMDLDVADLISMMCVQFMWVNKKNQSG